MDLEDLDFEAVDKEIEEDEAAQTVVSISAKPSQANKDDDFAPPAWFCLIEKFFIFCFVCMY